MVGVSRVREALDPEHIGEDARRRVNGAMYDGLRAMGQLKRGDRKGIRTAFDELYELRYAHHSPDEPVEMVNIRLGAIGKRPKLTFPSVAVTGTATPSGERVTPPVRGPRHRHRRWLPRAG